MSGPPPGYYDPESVDPAVEGADYAQWVEAFHHAQRHPVTRYISGRGSRIPFPVSQVPVPLTSGLYYPDTLPLPSQEYSSLPEHGASVSGSYHEVTPPPQTDRHASLPYTRWISDSNFGEALPYAPGSTRAGPSRLPSSTDIAQSSSQQLPQQPFTFSHYSPLDYSSASSISSPASTDAVASSSAAGVSGAVSRQTSPQASTGRSGPPKETSAARSKSKAHPRKRKRVAEPDEYAEEEATNTNASLAVDPSIVLTRRPGACKHCKKSKMKCDFPPGENTCRRCKASGRLCVVEGPKPQSQREDLLAQIRQKDAIIESLLRQLDKPHRSKAMPSPTQHGMPSFTSRPEDFNLNIWIDHLKSSGTSHKGSAVNAILEGVSGSTDDSADKVAASVHPPTDKTDLTPDEAIPIGLIANLSLTESEKTEVKEDQEDEEDVIGWADKTYFKPEPIAPTDFNIPAHLLQKNNLPDIVVHGLVSPTDVDKLFKIYFTRMNPHIVLLDPVLHTPATTFSRCPFLFSVVCAVASRYYDEKPEMYPIAMHFAKHAAANALISGRKCVELALAYMLLAYYAEPAKRWEEHRTWLYIGLGLRIATDLNLHQMPSTKPTTERQERELLNRVRVWLNCFILDRSISTYYGRPFTFKEDYIIRSASVWYKSSRYSHPCDIGLCAYASMLRITSRFNEEVFSDPDAPTGLNKSVDFLEITMTFDDLLSQYLDEWKERFARDAELTDPQALFRRHLLPYVSSYARLVMWSFGFQQAFQRGMQPRDRILLDKCFENASTVISSMVINLAPSGYMRFASEGHFTFATFASAFLVKLLKPEFAKLFDNKQRYQIFEQIEQLIQTYSSVEIATDDKHTPRQHASFLSTLLSRHRKGFPPGTLIAWQTEMGSGGSIERRSPLASGVLSDVQDTTGPLGSTEFISTTVPPGLPPRGDDDATMSFDDELLGALEVFKNPGYWESMMMPGLHWPEGDQNPNPLAAPSAGAYGYG